MSKKIYQLQIQCHSKATKTKVSQILGKFPVDNSSSFWTLRVEENETDAYYDFVSNFIQLLDGKLASLKSMGISNNDITFWVLYEYEFQCNFEISPIDMERLGKWGISLCLSCWQTGSNIQIDN